MKRNIIATMFALFVVMLFSGAIFAYADDTNTTKTGRAQPNPGMINELNARYANMECRLNLIKTQSGLLNSSLSADQISADLAQLKSFADSGDSKGFNGFITRTLTSDFKDFNGKLQDARKDFVKQELSDLQSGNMTRDQRMQERKQLRDNIISGWKSNIKDYTNCLLNSQKNIVQVRGTNINNQIAIWNKQIDAMNKVNLSTTVQQGIITEAQNLVTELNTASSATNESDYKTQMDAINDQYLHLWARMSIANIESYLTRATPFANDAGLSDKVTAIQALLDSASQTATQGQAYAEGQFAQTWNQIKQAQTQLQDLVKEIKSKI